MNDHHIIRCIDDTMYGIGDNTNCQLGSSISYRNAPIKLNINIKYVNIAFGLHHTLFLTTDAELYGLGDNGCGQLGIGKSIVQQENPKKIMDNIKMIGCGDRYSLAYAYDNMLYFFGAGKVNPKLVLDYNSYIPTVILDNINIKKMMCGGDHFYLLDENNKLHKFGCNGNNQLDFGEIDQPLKKIACGKDFTVALTNNDIWVCGNNENGEIGLSENENMNSSQVLDLGELHIVDVCCGRFYSALLTDDGKVYVNGRIYVYDKLEKMKLISTNTKYMIGGSESIILFQNNDDVIYHHKNIKIQTLTFDKKISMINNQLILWSPDHHKYLNKEFKDQIVTLMMIYDRFKKSRYPIGKYVIFEIIHRCI